MAGRCRRRGRRVAGRCRRRGRRVAGRCRRRAWRNLPPRRCPQREWRIRVSMHGGYAMSSSRHRTSGALCTSAVTNAPLDRFSASSVRIRDGRKTGPAGSGGRAARQAEWQARRGCDGRGAHHADGRPGGAAAGCRLPQRSLTPGAPHQPLHPGPLTTRPGVAPVCSPSLRTGVPFTRTCSTPVAYWCGSSNVAWSMMVAGSKTTTSAW
jgi:hypothetical protein